MHSPWWWVADTSLGNRFRFRSPLNESTRITLRWELFNSLNHNNLGSPSTRIDAPPSQAAHVFGTATTMRRMQLGLHLYF